MSHISAAQIVKNDVFLYIMEDVNESLREHNIIVDGINDFSDSPHDIIKKAYGFRIYMTRSKSVFNFNHINPN